MTPTWLQKNDQTTELNYLHKLKIAVGHSWTNCYIAVSW